MKCLMIALMLIALLVSIAIPPLLLITVPAAIRLLIGGAENREARLERMAYDADSQRAMMIAKAVR